MAYQAGQKLGNYQLERFLGDGGFAEVYLGKHLYLHTLAAIKVLQRQSSGKALEKFLQEARIIASLKHPHIVGVLEFGIEEQCPFLVMAYAPHGTLRRRYPRGNVLAPTLILPHILQVAGALHYAHERKIIHRDIKPENMLLDENNRVLLSDFGLALRPRSMQQSVHSTDSAGTTTYMAPEQLQGKPCAASDQYALGVVMYEWLCGCPPFDGPDMSVVVHHLHKPPVPLRAHVPTLPIEVEAVVLRALEKEPQRRFASVQELATAFEDACKDIPLSEDAIAMYARDDLHYEGTSFSAEFVVSQQDAITDGLLVPLPDTFEGRNLFGGHIPLAVAGSAHHSSLQAPSLSASLDLDVSTASQESANKTILVPESVVDATGSVTSSQTRPSLSRRTMLVGIAGIGALLGGVGIWGFSSPLAVDHSIATKSRTSATPSTKGPSPTASVGSNSNSNGGTKSNTSNAAASPTSGGATGSSPSSTPPSSTSSNTGGTPAATSTSSNSTGGTRSTPQAAALTVQVSVPSVIQQNSDVPIAATTNLGNISFAVTAEFYYTDNAGQTQNTEHAYMSGNTTDGSGHDTFNWQCWHIPPGQLKKMTNPRAVFQATATDGTGKSVSSQMVTAQVTG